MRTDLPTGTVTFLFTDIEGSTRLLAALGPERYAAELMEHRATIRSACRANGGTEVDTQGDAFFFVFPTAVGAIQAAAGLTGQLATGPIRVRVGLHTGTPLRVEEGYVGDDVHLAARVAAAAHGGQVVLTEATRASLDQSVTIRTLGEHRLKDIPDPVSLSQLGDARFPPLRTVANTNLPASTDAFIGRREELDLIDRSDRGGWPPADAHGSRRERQVATRPRGRARPEARLPRRDLLDPSRLAA